MTNVERSDEYDEKKVEQELANDVVLVFRMIIKRRSRKREKKTKKKNEQSHKTRMIISTIYCYVILSCLRLVSLFRVATRERDDRSMS
jgi:hypothetical protein